MRILCSILLLLAFLPDYSGPARLPLLPSELVITAKHVVLDESDPSRTRLGGLTFLGGVQLASSARDFGGFSAMAIDGDRFTLLSDGGNLVTFRMGADWHPRDARAKPLPAGPGNGWQKHDRDSESLTRDPRTGRWWVGFERAHEIWRFDPDFSHGEASVAPAAMADWPENGGAELMTRLRDGSFIVIAEQAKGAQRGTRIALWFAGDPVSHAPRFSFAYRPPEGFRPTDMAELPDGRLVVINRHFSFQTQFSAVVTLVERSAIRAGGIATGREIARFAPPIIHDNFEAVAVTREGDDTILWVASDDNQQLWQRSLLLKFRLDDLTMWKRRTARIPGGSGPI